MYAFSLAADVAAEEDDMGGSKSKIEFAVAKGEAAAVLRSLAAGLEAGEAELGGSRIDLSGFGKLKIALKAAGETLFFSLRLKAEKTPPVCTCETPPCVCGAAEAQAAAAAGTGYKPVKKRLKKSWNGVKEALALGGLPEAGLLDSFAADFSAMLTYPDKGAPEYPANAAALAELLAAVAAGDHDRASAAAAEIERLKKSCHKLYK